MNRQFKVILILLVLIVTGVAVSIFYLPTNRVGITSELIMLGDLNDDNRWDNKDKKHLADILLNPFSQDKLTLLKIDINKNGSIDSEDLGFFDHIIKYPNPYLALEQAKGNNNFFPRPRELFKYLPKSEYIQQPLIMLPHKIMNESPLKFLRKIKINPNESSYNNKLLHEICNEALRFTFAFSIRKTKLTNIEACYVNKKIQICENLFEQNEYFELLLNLISLVEDAETLTVTAQSDFIKKVLYFRDNLRKLFLSQEYKSFKLGKTDHVDIFKKIEADLKSDLNISLDLNKLPPPRDLSNLKNYLDRAEWQAFKSTTRNEEFKQLVLYAQYDRRYLRAVSKTSPGLSDLQLKNHNLPMILLFREALKITKNDKKSAVGLLDEAVRIPMGWVKGIPKKLLPSSVALENFLLPGNKEDGSDKSRHWNVFGGVAIYKSPKESLILALKREIMDLREQNYSEPAMREFIRDKIANINGIYYVESIISNLIDDMKG